MLTATATVKQSSVLLPGMEIAGASGTEQWEGTAPNPTAHPGCLCCRRVMFYVSPCFLPSTGTLWSTGRFLPHDKEKEISKQIERG